MLLFKDFHVGLIQNDIKTATRRQWDRCRVKVGSIHQCRTTLFGVEPFARVRIVKVYEQPLNEMRAVEYAAEGGYTKETFIDAWKSINGSYDPLEVVWVIEFERVREAV